MPLLSRVAAAFAVVSSLAVARLALASQPPVSQPPASQPSLILEGEAAEAFLRSASVVDRQDIGTGITRSQRVTLSDGTRTARAAWKTIDVHTLGQQRMEQGWEFDFRDSWKNEVAGYELDKLLGLHLVPPTVERRLDGHAGSLQLWVEHAMTEDERRKRHVDPPHVARWNDQLHNVRLLHQLAYNTDYQNVRNVLVDPSFRVYAIDNSRAFRIQHKLLSAADLVCFSRTTLERLRALDLPTLQEHLGPWLDKTQLEALLARRDAILAIVHKRILEKGEGAVLFY